MDSDDGTPVRRAVRPTDPVTERGCRRQRRDRGPSTYRAATGALRRGGSR